MFVTPQTWGSPAHWPAHLSLGQKWLWVPFCWLPAAVGMSSVPCPGWSAPARYSPIHLLCSSPSQPHSVSFYFVLTSLHPLHDFLLAKSCIYGSLKARALLVAGEIILSLISLSFISAQDADTSNREYAQPCPLEQLQLCTAMMPFICYIGMCKERKYRFSNSSINIFI